jgi:alginate O-acetyltransferase complex protein AlgJ
MTSYQNLILPFVFFGYAAFVNAAVFLGTGECGFEPAPSNTTTLTELYVARQPHQGLAHGLWGAVRYLAFGQGKEGVITYDAGWLFTAEEARAALPDAEAAAIMDRAMALADEIRNVDSRLVVVFVPTKMRVSLGQETAADRAAAILRAAMAKQGVATFDAADALQDPKRDFFATDTHWTPQATRSVAALLADRFAWLNGETVFQEERKAAQSFAGDLVSFVTTDAFADWIGLPAEQVTPFAARAPKAETVDLFGATTGHILVGTSYSADPRWSFEAALKIALSQDVINHARVGQGPFAALEKYLQNPTPGATVIWEFPARYLTDPARATGGL